jgi:hypothetical protein
MFGQKYAATPNGNPDLAVAFGFFTVNCLLCAFRRFGFSFTFALRPARPRNYYPLMADQPSWAETAASLLTRLSGGIELNCGFDQMELQVPNQQNPAGPPATWRLNGTLRIRTKGDAPGGLTISAGAPKSSAPDAETPRG